jgi:hypothetical protein
MFFFQLFNFIGLSPRNQLKQEPIELTIGEEADPYPLTDDTKWDTQTFIPPEAASSPRLRSFHSVITSSMATFVSSSNDINTCLNSLIHSRSCRTQDQGLDQSSKITIRVSETDRGVRSGRISGVKDGEGSDRR